MCWALDSQPALVRYINLSVLLILLIFSSLCIPEAVLRTSVQIFVSRIFEFYLFFCFQYVTLILS